VFLLTSPVAVCENRLSHVTIALLSGMEHQFHILL
jgi:hypothetical protein